MKGPKAKVRRRDSPDTSSTSDTPPPPFLSNDITHCGWLSRQNHKSRFKKTWPRCWFVIADGQLHYFKHQGSVPLQGCTMTSRNSKDTDQEPPGYVLEIHQSNETPSHNQSQKPFLLSAQTQSEIDTWKREIRRVRGGVFGATLEDTIVNESENETKEIPAVVELCVSYIREHGLMEEGIFRLNGRTGMVQDLQDAIDTGEQPDFDKLEVGVHTVASLLKRYFQLLPEPIIPWRHCKYFISVMQMLREKEEEGRRQLILQLALLPRVNYNLLKYLCEFLHEVHLYEDKNKMGLGNLANIFAPHILRPQNAQGAYLLGSTALSLQLVHYLIRNQAKVFPPLDSINTSPPTALRSGYRNDTAAHRIYRKGTNEYKLDKVERRSEESRARSKSRTNRRSGRVDWCASTEIIDGECIDTVKVKVHSVYENMDIANGLSLIESIKSRISETSSKTKTNGAHKVKRYGVSYKDPSSILSSALGQRSYSTPGKDEAFLRGKKENGDRPEQVQIQSTYQNIELEPTILQTIATSMKDHAMSVSNGDTNSYQKPDRHYHHNGNSHHLQNGDSHLHYNGDSYSHQNGDSDSHQNGELYQSSDLHSHKNSKHLLYQNGEDRSTYENRDLAVNKKTGPTCTFNVHTGKETTNLYQNPLPFPITLPDDFLQELKSGTERLQHNSVHGAGSLIPKPTNKEYASSDIINGHSNTLPMTNGNSGFTFNGKMTVNSKVPYNGEVPGHMQALKTKLRQKDEEMSKQYQHVELMKRDYELMKVRLCAEESARIMIEEHNRQLESENLLLQKRLGLVA